MRAVQEREIVVFRYRKGLRIGLHLETAQSKARVETEKGRAFTVPSENLIFSTRRTACTTGSVSSRPSRGFVCTESFRTASVPKPSAT